MNFKLCYSLAHSLSFANSISISVCIFHFLSLSIFCRYQFTCYCLTVGLATYYTNTVFSLFFFFVFFAAGVVGFAFFFIFHSKEVVCVRFRNEKERYMTHARRLPLLENSCVLLFIYLFLFFRNFKNTQQRKVYTARSMKQKN